MSDKTSAPLALETARVVNGMSAQTFLQPNGAGAARAAQKGRDRNYERCARRPCGAQPRPTQPRTGTSLEARASSGASPPCARPAPRPARHSWPLAYCHPGACSASGDASDPGSGGCAGSESGSGSCSSARVSGSALRSSGMTGASTPPESACSSGGASGAASGAPAVTGGGASALSSASAVGSRCAGAWATTSRSWSFSRATKSVGCPCTPWIWGLGASCTAGSPRTARSGRSARACASCATAAEWKSPRRSVMDSWTRRRTFWRRNWSSSRASRTRRRTRRSKPSSRARPSSRSRTCPCTRLMKSSPAIASRTARRATASGASRGVRGALCTGARSTAAMGWSMYRPCSISTCCGCTRPRVGGRGAGRASGTGARCPARARRAWCASAAGPVGMTGPSAGPVEGTSA
mmetsp:Transcript_9603/g.32552  ORF Transcript_9603/g.32552 Transcript_9603/m.32552 type:complete len:409 (+) Transcript_9603:201-1427(+)